MSLDPAPLPEQGAPSRERGAWVKWVVLGCVSFVFLITAGITGCFVAFVRSAEKSTQAWDELGDRHTRHNAFVEEHLGRVKRVTFVSKFSTATTRTMRYHVVGELAEGDVFIEAGFLDPLHPKMMAAWLDYRNRSIDLVTGKELGK